MNRELITDNRDVEDIILNSGGICQLSMIANNKPYSVPMNFGYQNGILYFHGSYEGRKIDALKYNPDVCVSFYINGGLNVRHENMACSYSMKFKSVLAHGAIVFVEDITEKHKIMNIIMKNYTGRDNFIMSDAALKNVCVFYLNPSKITAFNRGCI